MKISQGPIFARTLARTGGHAGKLLPSVNGAQYEVERMARADWD
jgi:hypothetical protein